MIICVGNKEEQESEGVAEVFRQRGFGVDERYSVEQAREAIRKRRYGGVVLATPNLIYGSLEESWKNAYRLSGAVELAKIAKRRGLSVVVLNADKPAVIIEADSIFKKDAKIKHYFPRAGQLFHD